MCLALSKPGDAFALRYSIFCLLLTSVAGLVGCNESGVSAQNTRTQVSALGATPVNPSVFNVVDTNPDPAVFEASLTADEQDVLIDGTTVHAMVYKDDNSPGLYAGVSDGIPVPQIVVNVGDEVIVTLTNDLEPGCAAVACDTSIHWHGIELDNDSDGTGVTQNHLTPGETYTYRFTAPRAGVFWFHPHMKPGAQAFAGMYGAFIVRDPEEPTLQADEIIPPESNTFTVVLSDIEYGAGGDVGYLHDASVIGDGDASTSGYTEPGTDVVNWQLLVEECTPPDPGIENSCIRFTDAATVLVNGQKPTASTPIIKARSGAGIRLRMLNLSTTRYFRLAVTGNGVDNNLYRIGGEGGLLENVRLEGGVLGTWDTGYAKGEIVLSASGRTDVVVVPTGNDGDIIAITDLPYSRSDSGGGPSTQGLGSGDLLYIEIDNTLDDDTYTITEGMEVRPDSIEDLKTEAISDFFIAPVATGNPGDGAGSTDPVIRLNGVGPGETAIDSVVGHFEDSGPDFTQVPYQGATRYARTGDLLEFTVSNFTQQHHPFHHHGFSFQPVRIIDNGPDKTTTADDSILYEFDYDEFVDVIDVFDGQSVVLRMRLEDRPRITDTRQEAGAPAPDQFFASGGAAGRWVMHCHLFMHAATGMISELVVVDTDRDGDGFDTSLDCDDFNVDVNPDVTEICADGIDNNCDGSIDEAGCNHPPVADAGGDRVLECTSPDGAFVMLDGSGSSDADSDPLTYLWSAPGIVFDDPASETPVATFPFGSTVVTLTVSDGQLDDSDSANIAVADTTPPVLEISPDPSMLWPPNHEMVEINANVTVTDTCDENPTFVLDAVASNEPDNGIGDGNTVNDIQGVDAGFPDTVFRLRAERSGTGSGRVYTMEYTATDVDGNTASASAGVVVPKSN